MGPVEHVSAADSGPHSGTRRCCHRTCLGGHSLRLQHHRPRPGNLVRRRAPQGNRRGRRRPWRRIQLSPPPERRTPTSTIVEFFDYNCPFCKKTAPELQKFLHTDAKVRVLYKEWPIFGDVSEYAARCALAAHWQGKFLVAHDTLIASPTDLDENSQVDTLLKKAGLDMTQLSHDRATHAAEITAILSRNSKEAASLGFKGTPAFIIGRQLIPQSLTVQTLQQFTQNARQSP